MAARRRSTDEGHAEQQQPGHRDHDRRPLAARQPADERSEQRDAARRGGLNERQRRERERDDVEDPAADPRQEANDPAAVPEQQPQRVQWSSHGERRQPRRGTVLREVAPVEGGRGREREHEARAELRGHCRSRPLNGRYASAASAAIPTRGRRRSAAARSERTSG